VRVPSFAFGTAVLPSRFGVVDVAWNAAVRRAARRA
jgi:hypothetical protein